MARCHGVCARQAQREAGTVICAPCEHEKVLLMIPVILVFAVQYDRVLYVYVFVLAR